MRFGSVCSGIEAASVAWHPLGWKAAWFSEIEPFPCAVLAHHYPNVPNLGDMTTIARRVLTGEVEAPDVLTGGTPCQAFSVAGLRESLADERGNLTLKFVELADAIDHVRRRAGKPECVVVWENVPGVLSTKDNAFGCFLGGLAGEDGPLEPPGGRWADSGCVYGPARAIAWRTLDAQYFGLAQRRRRVVLVASSRAGFDPATVLFEWQGVRRDSSPSREAGQRLAPTLAARTQGGGGLGTDFDCDGGLVHAYGGGNTAGAIDVGACLTHHSGRNDFDSETFIAHSLRGEGFDASEDGTGRGTPLVPVQTVGSLTAGHGGSAGHQYRQKGNEDALVPVTFEAVPQAHAFDARQSDVIQYGDKTGPLDTDWHSIGVLTEPYTLAIRGRGDSHNLEYRQDGTANALLTPNGGRGGVGVGAIAFSAKDHGGDAAVDLAPTLRAGGHADSHANAGVMPAVVHSVCLGSDPIHARELAMPQTTRNGDPGVVQQAMQVRRLTPRECERLQGFEDDFTLIPWRGKPASECPDGPRYKALGNSWAVPKFRWVGRRIDAALRRTT